MTELVREAAALESAAGLNEENASGPTVTYAEQVTRMPVVTGGGAVDKALRRSDSACDTESGFYF